MIQTESYIRDIVQTKMALATLSLF